MARSKGLPSQLAEITSALHSAKYTSGSTHNFYLYPARFSPEIARAVIEVFSDVNDWVLDPFMGGGTAIIEGLSLGRRMIGVDLNALAHFVADVRTSPLSALDEECIRRWTVTAARRPGSEHLALLDSSQVTNLPASVKVFLSGALTQLDSLPFPRQRAFAKCTLLRLGQWALDCRDVAPPRQDRLAKKLSELAEGMLDGLGEFVEQCRAAGVPKNQIASRRVLLYRDAAGLEHDPRIELLNARPRLVFTSPPYPRVHVLYHRWQLRGRKETSAPYWIAQVPDGYYASHYTGGSRTPTGERRYFAMVETVFSSVRELIADDGLVVQLVGFAETRAQLPQYLAAMKAAGFEEWTPPLTEEQQLERYVPNRKWYAKLQGSTDAASELLLFHRPRSCRPPR
jgi:hypothetical protein